MELTIVIFLAAVAAAIVAYSIALPQGGKSWWLLALPTMLLALGGALSDAIGGGTWIGFGLLEAAELLSVALIASRATPESRNASKRCLVATLLAIACVAPALAAVDSGVEPGSAAAKAAVAALAVGFSLKLALVPFYFWFPGVVEHSSPMTSAILVSVVDVASLAELLGLRATAPWVFEPYAALWLGLALLSMLGGALLALAQRDLKRMLAFSTMDDMGYLLLGIVVGGGLGTGGAALAAMSHSLCKVILFGAVGVAERGEGGPASLDSRGLAARYPAAGAAFIAGALGFMGVPPFFGFVGRWRLYAAGGAYGGPALLGAMILASGLALLYYARAIHRAWLGPADGALGDAKPDGRVRAAEAVLIALVAAALLLGAWPEGWAAAEGPFAAAMGR